MATSVVAPAISAVGEDGDGRNSAAAGVVADDVPLDGQKIDFTFGADRAVVGQGPGGSVVDAGEDGAADGDGIDVAVGGGDDAGSVEGEGAADVAADEIVGDGDVADVCGAEDFAGARSDSAEEGTAEGYVGDAAGGLDAAGIKAFSAFDVVGNGDWAQLPCGGDGASLLALPPVSEPPMVTAATLPPA